MKLTLLPVRHRPTANGGDFEGLLDTFDAQATLSGTGSVPFGGLLRLTTLLCSDEPP